MKKIYLLLLLPVIALTNSCSVKLNGASIPKGMKSVQVAFIENNAPLVVPTLSQDLTEALKTRIRNTTSLSIDPNNADAIFEARITAFDYKVIALQNVNNPSAGGNRLTIRIAVKYTNNILPKTSFEESFERYDDFVLGSNTIESLQPGLITNINAQLVEDIFNRAFAQW